MIVVKSNEKEKYNDRKIFNAILQAQIQSSHINIDEVEQLTNEITALLVKKSVDDRIDVKDIENTVMSVLYANAPDIARAYSSYKMNQERMGEKPSEIEKVLCVKHKDVTQENANKNTELAHIKNAYLAEIPSRQAMRNALPPECLEAHDRGVVYFNDLSYSFRPLHNCELLNLDALLQGGLEINGTWIEKPHSFRTACTITTQILTHVASNSYGLN